MLTPQRRTLPVLPYRKPTEGRDYWLLDDALPDPLAVRARTLARSDWTLGYPHTPESWPGMRVMSGLEPVELEGIELFPGLKPDQQWDFSFWCEEASHWPVFEMIGWTPQSCGIDG